MKRTSKLTSSVDVTVMNTRVTRLVHCNKFAEVENLLRSLPNSPEYQENEGIIRARIALAWYKKDVQAVYKLIEVIRVGLLLLQLSNFWFTYALSCMDMLPVVRFAF